MTRCWVIVMVLVLLAGCGERPAARMEHPEDPHGPYREQIAAAKRMLQQEERWASRAEFEVKPNGDGWKVTAWRIEHPQAKGSSRYAPWGYCVIELDSKMVPVRYLRKG